MATEAQNLGLQEVPETEVRSGGQMAGSIAAGAASGAAAGSVVAPWGTIIGAVVGGGIAAVGQFTGRAKERKQLEKDRTFNEYVDRMKETYGGEYTEQMMVARDGMVKAEEGFNMVEYEDGEIHARPTYDFKGNLKDIDIIQKAPEGIKHEDAKGENPAVLIPTEEGKSDPSIPVEVQTKEPIVENDVIFKSQDDKYRASLLADISAFKQGDNEAGKRIMGEINKLPVDTSMARHGAKYTEGITKKVEEEPKEDEVVEKTTSNDELEEQNS